MNAIPLAALSWFFLLVALSWVWLSGCAYDVTMVRETARGGTVAYSVKDEGTVLVSPSRAEALVLIEQKCGRAYHIVREGQIPRLSKKVDQTWSGQIRTDLLWGLQFVCD